MPQTPRFSIITPTHKPRFLTEAYASLLAQSDAAPTWEWVIAYNGYHNDDSPVTQQDVEAALTAHAPLVPNIRIVHIPATVGTHIGAIKQFAFKLGVGDWLLELDHDDLLTPDALYELDTVACARSEAGFIYSDFADFGPGATYANNIGAWMQSGWRFAPENGVAGAPLVPLAFAPSAASLSRILWAPNHVRVWRRDVYHALDGHNPAYSICDDHELMVRTYLHTAMAYVPRVLYRYRVHAANTWAPRAAEIAKLSADIGANNIEALLLREGVLTGRPCIDLGAERAPREGWQGCDIEPGPNIAHVWDLNDTPWPWETGSVQAFRAHDVLEHLHDKMATMREIWRCLAPGGWLLSETPSTDGRGAHMDPTHVSFWNQNSFWYWIRDEQAHFIKNDDIRFSVSELATYFPSAWHREHNISYVRARLWKPGLGFPRSTL